MADISSIKLNDTTYNIKDETARNNINSISTNLNSYLPLSGGTMTGTIVMTNDGAFRVKNDVFDKTIVPASNVEKSPFNVRDVNDATIASVRVHQTTDNEIGIGLNALSKNVLTAYVKNDDNKTVRYSIENPDAFCNAANAVNKSGDTMTGLLKLASDGMEMNNDAGYTIDQYGNFMHKRNTADDFWNFKNNAGTATVKMYFENGKIIANGDIESVNGSINVNTSNNGTYRGFRVSTGDGYCAILNTGKRLTFDQYLHGSTGGERFLLPVPDSRNSDAWYSILTSKSPVTTAQGGTGGTDSGWQSYTNSNVFTGTIFYRKVGVFFMIQAQQIQVKNTIAAGSYVTLMNVPSAYRPSKEVSPMCFINSNGVNVRVVPMRLSWGGDLILYANKNDAITSSYNLYFSGFGLI